MQLSLFREEMSASFLGPDCPSLSGEKKTLFEVLGYFFTCTSQENNTLLQKFVSLQAGRCSCVSLTENALYKWVFFFSLNYLVSLAMVIRLTESLPNLHLVILHIGHTFKLKQRIISTSSEYNQRDTIFISLMQK